MCRRGHLIFPLTWGEDRFLFFSSPTPTPEPAIQEHNVSPIAASEIEVLDGDGRPHMRSIGSSDLAVPLS